MFRCMFAISLRKASLRLRTSDWMAIRKINEIVFLALTAEFVAEFDESGDDAVV